MYTVYLEPEAAVDLSEGGWAQGRAEATQRGRYLQETQAWGSSYTQGAECRVLADGCRGVAGWGHQWLRGIPAVPCEVVKSRGVLAQDKYTPCHAHCSLSECLVLEERKG